MRRWIALLISTAAIALAGTALALAGSSDGGQVDEAPQATEAKESFESVEFEEIPKGMLEADSLPERKEVRQEVEKDEPLEEKPVEKDEPVEKEPVDETAPEIEVLYPEDGQVFEKKEVVFEGETEAGARVFAGKWEADVSDTGAWRIVLILQKGENNVTFKAKDRAGNVGTDSVTVIYKAPEPKPEPPKDEEPKDEKPAEWEFSAKQLYGECGEETPYDVFWGTGKPGSLIFIESKYGGGVAEIGEHGKWEIKVIFENAPENEVFPVYVTDKFGHKKVFEFVHTGGGEGKDH